MKKAKELFKEDYPLCNNSEINSSATIVDKTNFHYEIDVGLEFSDPPFYITPQYGRGTYE